MGFLGVGGDEAVEKHIPEYSQMPIEKKFLSPHRKHPLIVFFLNWIETWDQKQKRNEKQQTTNIVPSNKTLLQRYNFTLFEKHTAWPLNITHVQKHNGAPALLRERTMYIFYSTLAVDDGHILWFIWKLLFYRRHSIVRKSQQPSTITGLYLNSDYILPYSTPCFASTLASEISNLIQVIAPFFFETIHPSNQKSSKLTRTRTLHCQDHTRSNRESQQKIKEQICNDSTPIIKIILIFRFSQVENLADSAPDEGRASYQACKTIADTYMTMSGPWAEMFSSQLQSENQSANYWHNTVLAHHQGLWHVFSSTFISCGWIARKE